MRRLHRQREVHEDLFNFFSLAPLVQFGRGRGRRLAATLQLSCAD